MLHAGNERSCIINTRSFTRRPSVRKMDAGLKTCVRNTSAVRCQGKLYAPKRQASFSSSCCFVISLSMRWITFQATFLDCSKKGRSPNLRHVSRTHLVDLGQLLPRINVDGSVAIRHVRTTEQLADILTNGAFTTTQWTFLMQFLDIRPPPKWNVDRWFSKSSCSTRISHTTSGVHNTQRDFEHGSEKEKLEDSSAGVEENSAWSNSLLRTGCSSLGFAKKKLCLAKPMRFSGQKTA